MRGVLGAIAMMVLVHCAPPDKTDVHESQTSSSVMLSPASTVKWFVAEGGTTIGGFSDYHDFKTFYNFANTNNTTVQVMAHFSGETGAWDQAFSLAPNSRTTREFFELTGRRGFHSAEFYSNTPGQEIQVSATTFNDGFDPVSGAASSAVNGSTEVRTQWRFGEGGAYGWVTPLPVFDNWFVVYNPNGTPIQVSGDFRTDDINPLPPMFLAPVGVAAQSRFSFKPFDTLATGNAAQVRSATITCSQPCVAQLVMRQRSGIGTRETSSQTALGSQERFDWYFVGIPTSANWEPRLYMFNPGGATSDVTMTYYSGAGAPFGAAQTIHIPPQSRHSYDIHDELEDNNPSALNQDGNICLHVHATQPIAATKILYWPYGGDRWSEGASTTGHSQGGTHVIVPGGNVGGGFNNYVQLMNVGGTPTNVSVTIYRPSPIPPATYSLGSVPANGMRQLDASSYPGLDGDFTTKLDTDGGKIIAESSTYSLFTGPPLLWRAGDAVEGIVYDPGVSSFPIQP
jgi:hypothetical protein